MKSVVELFEKGFYFYTSKLIQASVQCALTCLNEFDINWIKNSENKSNNPKPRLECSEMNALYPKQSHDKCEISFFKQQFLSSHHGIDSGNSRSPSKLPKKIWIKSKKNC